MASEDNNEDDKVYYRSIKNELIIVTQNRRLFLEHFAQLIVYS